MKNLLLISALLSIGCVACGPNDEEKARIQQENAEMVDRKVNEIMEKLELDEKTNMPTEEVMDEKIATDSLNVDSTVAE